MSTPSDSLRFWLRDVTRPLHEAVDQVYAGYSLREREGYAAFLSAHAAALAPVEAWLDAAGAGKVLPDWPARARLPALRADLAGLGETMPEPVAWRLEATPAALWGVAYVLEGSRLGARHLARQVPPGFPCAYLRHGEGAALWPGFVQRLEAAGEALERDAVRHAAHAAFAAFLEAGRQQARAQAQA